MDKDSKFTRDEEGYIAVRVVSGTEALPAADKDYMFARDTNGNIAVRVVGAGGDQHNMGYFATPAALAEAYPAAEAGDYAIVGSTDTIWIWDEDNSEWVDSDRKGQVTSVNNQTGDVSLDINDVAPTQTDKSGYVLGTDGFVAGWVKPEIVQRSAMPQASEDELGNVYQFVGTTDANYTNGYFYKCVSDGQNPVTYSWSQVDVQPAADPLPSQTGQRGKFLTTDGTDASWSNRIKIESDAAIRSYTPSGRYMHIYQSQSGNSAEIRFCESNDINFGSINFTDGLVYFVSKVGQYSSRLMDISNTALLHYGDNATLGNPLHNWKNVYTTKLSNGSDITVPTVGGKLALQVDTMPTAASTNEGIIYQFVGTTDANYTNGYFYKCVSDGAVTPTYSWTAVEVQASSGGLPSQTGQSGKFLTTDGTDASWSSISALQNTATAENSLTILGDANTTDRHSINIGSSSRIIQKDNYAYAVAIGVSAKATKGSCVLGTGAFCDNNTLNCTLLGCQAHASNTSQYAVAVGKRASANADYAIQIGTDGTVGSGVTTNNNDPSTLKVANANGNFEMMSADGTIPTARLTKVNTTITLTVAGWSSNTQTVNVTGMTATGVVFPCPIPADQAGYTSAGIVCSAQAAGTLTFTCDTVPSDDIDVTVVMM